jgi:hypothetical protein
LPSNPTNVNDPLSTQPISNRATIAEIASMLNSDNAPSSLVGNNQSRLENRGQTQVVGELAITEFPAHKPDIPLYQRIREDGNNPSARLENSFTISPEKIAAFLEKSGKPPRDIQLAMDRLDGPTDSLSSRAKPASLERGAGLA